jgi:hypothetical protein
MRLCAKLLALAACLAAGVGCQNGRHSPSGFRLPENGDAERGKAAFAALRCDSCHEVAGVDLPRPTDQAVTRVVLGGSVERAPTDGHLVTSIIYPSYRAAKGAPACMPAHEEITARQLTDIVAFLQAHYTVKPLPPRYLYH